VPLTQMPKAFLYLGCWFLMAGAVYYFFGIETKGKSIEDIDCSRAGPSCPRRLRCDRHSLGHGTRNFAGPHRRPQCDCKGRLGAAVAAASRQISTGYGSSILIEANRSRPLPLNQAVAFAHQGRPAEARLEIEAGLALDPRSTMPLSSKRLLRQPRVFG